MALDLKASIEKAVTKITSDKALQEQFKEDPVKAVESVLGVDLPDGAVDKIVDAVKVKLAAGKLGDTLGGLFGKK